MKLVGSFELVEADARRNLHYYIQQIFFPPKNTRLVLNYVLIDSKLK